MEIKDDPDKGYETHSAVRFWPVPFKLEETEKYKLASRQAADENLRISGIK